MMAAIMVRDILLQPPVPDGLGTGGKTSGFPQQAGMGRETCPI